jgi:hypothetical protein
MNYQMKSTGMCPARASCGMKRRRVGAVCQRFCHLTGLI